MGLRLTERDDRTLEVAGRYRGCDVRAEQEIADPQPVWRVRVECREMVSGLRLRPESMVDGLRKLVGAGDVVIGDAAFDAAVLVQGDELGLRAVFSHAVRRRVLGWLEQETRIEAPRIVWRGPLSPQPRTELVSLLRGLVALARSLSPGDAAACLARLQRHVERDPHPGVRHRCLNLLAARDPAAFEALFATLDESFLIRLLDHDDTAVACRAAAQLGEVGGPDCIPPLVASARGLFVAGELKAAARAAQQAVTARLGGLAGGGLAVVGEGGELALSDP